MHLPITSKDSIVFNSLFLFLLISGFPGAEDFYKNFVERHQPVVFQQGGHSQGEGDREAEIEIDWKREAEIEKDWKRENDKERRKR